VDLSRYDTFFGASRIDRRVGDMASKAEKIVAGLGGLDNIERVYPGSMSTIGVEVANPDLVDEAALKAADAPAVAKRHCYPGLHRPWR
jgi:PTS system N-acetylglucosamine-specific IIB component